MLEAAGLIIAIVGLILSIPSAAVSYRDWRRGQRREPSPGAQPSPQRQRQQAAYGDQAPTGSVFAGSTLTIGAPLSFARRTLAAVIDFWVVLTVSYLVPLIFEPNGLTETATEDEITTFAMVFYLTLFCVLLAYAWVLARTGRSVGKLVVGGRVVRVDDGAAPGFGRAVGRTALGLLLTLTCFFPLLIVYAVASRRPDRMAVQDLATGTHPVRVLKRMEAPARSGVPASE